MRRDPRHRAAPRRLGHHRDGTAEAEPPTVDLLVLARADLGLPPAPRPAPTPPRVSPSVRAPTHRSRQPLHPVGRSVVGAVAVLGVVGGVDALVNAAVGGRPSSGSGTDSDTATALSAQSAAAGSTTPALRPRSPEPPGLTDRNGARLPGDAGEPGGDHADGEGDGHDGDGHDGDGHDGDRHDDRGSSDRGDDERGRRVDDGGRGGRHAAGDPLDTARKVINGVQGVLGGRSKTSAQCGRPGKILDLGNWKLTLPTGSEGSPTEIRGPQLGSLSIGDFGTGRSCDAVSFRAPVNGVTTSGSKNPRSELRELADGGGQNAGWSSDSGTHTMTVTEAFNHLPTGKPHLVGAQIHDASDDISVFRLEGRNLWVTDGDNPHYKLVTSDYTLGTPFEAKYVVSGGQVRAFYNGKLVATLAKSFSDAYFKAGAYTQAHCGDAGVSCSSDNYGETLIYKLNVTHS